MTTTLAPPRSAAVAPDRLAWTGFELDGRVFAFPYLSVERVVPATPVTAVPFAPASVEGVASISGDIIPVLALAVLLDIDRPQPAQAGTQFLVHPRVRPSVCAARRSRAVRRQPLDRRAWLTGAAAR